MKFADSVVSSMSPTRSDDAANDKKRKTEVIQSPTSTTTLLQSECSASKTKHHVSTSRSRERNRVHAQRTRLRKKEHMQTLQNKADELKAEQLKLRQIINEKNTATILVRLFAEGGAAAPEVVCQEEDPLVERVLKRPQEEIPDASTIPELPALILPGQHASKKIRANMQSQAESFHCDLSLDGIDYELLGRDRSQCTAEELDLIRRERNRMHAKRTRDRKRIFTEKLAEICRQLEEENILLHLHLKKIDPEYKYDPPPAPVKSSPTSSTQSSPTMQPINRNIGSVSSLSLISQSSDGSNHNRRNVTNNSTLLQKHDGSQMTIYSLLKAAELELHEISDVSTKSTTTTTRDDQDFCNDIHHSSKRQRCVLA